jgi:hypothetical protein
MVFSATVDIENWFVVPIYAILIVNCWFSESIFCPSEIRPEIVWKSLFSYIWTGKLDIEDYILFVTFYEYHTMS